jgi:PAS domain S-box-containing protein
MLSTSRVRLTLYGNEQTGKRYSLVIQYDLVGKEGAMQQIILLFQENAVKAAIVQELLTRATGKRFAVEWVRSCAAALERMSDHHQAKIAAILIDLRSPDGQQLAIFDRIFQASLHTPILVLSGPEHEGIAERAVQRGAQDYILDNQLDGYSLLKAVRNMLERTAIADASFVEKERAQVTLNSIGDAVISTDITGNVTYLNHVAETMTGWSSAEALGHSFSEVFQITDSTGAEHARNPIALAMQEDKTVGLAAGSILTRRSSDRHRGLDGAHSRSQRPDNRRRNRVSRRQSGTRHVTAHVPFGASRLLDRPAQPLVVQRSVGPGNVGSAAPRRTTCRAIRRC